MQFQFETIEINSNIENLKIQVIEMNKYDDEIEIKDITEQEFIEIKQ